MTPSALTIETSDKDWLAKTLEMDIIFGRLYPNQRLIEDELMDRFGQSRHRVRRAIDTLVLGGLAIREVNKGAHVCSYSGTEIEQMYELRNILHAAALERIDFPLSAEALQDLRDIHDAHGAAIAAQDFPQVFQLNNAFHKRIFACCGSPVLCEAISVQARRTYPIRSLNFHQSGFLEETQAEHAQMIGALEAGNLAVLIPLHAEHILRPMQAYLAQYDLGRG
ncbi:GntR family transcriptional regulator [Sulfitobacter albidus]|uniref:GntR family transcriptional regulator n=1 Tax=Sulfitobacter albidus TaxID=2829501 RepID=A0A975PMX8_9RHOB|nr:GntR family transcriptional regulator [Sulfitobacter albidus]QUJ76715.1 GntR family transcriptional regulator [Sulfitobacter albidus]